MTDRVDTFEFGKFVLKLERQLKAEPPDAALFADRSTLLQALTLTIGTRHFRAAY